MKPILVFQTDFTYKEGAVSAMYGVVKSVDPTLEIIDATHEIPQYDIWSASYRLYQPILFWPEGTIFVSVVDPGVGTARRACVARTKSGHYIVTPDNGTLTHIKEYVGITEVREIDLTRNRLRGKGTETVTIFGGRDIFGYCAAKLAAGIITYEEVGKAYPVDEIVSLGLPESSFADSKAYGICEIEDPNFGNLWTNIETPKAQENGFEYGNTYHVEITRKGETKFSADLPFVHSFGDVSLGEAMIYNNELNRLALSVNQGSFIEKFGVGFGSDYKITVS